MVLCLCGGASILRADTLTASWNANPETDIAGYTLSYGTTSGQFTSIVDVGNVTTRQVTLSAGTRYYFVVQAYNTAGAMSPPSAEVSIDLSIVNRAPSITQPAAQTSAENSVVALQLNGSDPDGNPLIYSVSGLPLSLAINAVTGLISGTLSYTSAGNYTVTATVSDGALAASATFTWTVANVNRPPALNAVPDQTSSVTSTVSLTLVASDPDGQALTYGAAGLPASLVLDATTGVISGTLLATSAGVYPVTISVSDGNLSDSRLFTWTVVSRSSVLTRATDFDGDGKSDFAMYRPSTGQWSLLFSGTNYTTGTTTLFGSSSDRPVPGAYDADKKTDVATYSQYGVWSVLPSMGGTTPIGVSVGRKGDRAVPADYDGDGYTDMAVFRPNGSKWIIRRSSTNYSTSVTIQFGSSTDRLVPADYDGDGKADIAVFKRSGTWSILQSSTNNTTRFDGVWGVGTDIPVPADYDGDGAADIAVYRPSTGEWLILTSGSRFTKSMTIVNGGPTDVPVVGDFDGDGRADCAVFRPSTGTWFVLKSGAGYTTSLTVTGGNGTDQPLPLNP
jgi:hypothetical protein